MLHNEAEDIRNDEVFVFKRRWLLLFVTCLWSTIDVFLSLCFGAADELFAVYFQANLDRIDWMLLGLHAGTVVVTPIFAYLCHAEYMGFRNMSIAAILCLLVSCIATILSVQYPFLYLILIPINFLHGIAYSVSACVATFFPVLWFPDKEVSFAIASVGASMSLGGLLGAIIPPEIIKRISFGVHLNQSIGADNELRDWKESTHDALLWLFSTLAVTLCLLLIYIAIFAEDLPPKPPTYAMLVKRCSNTKKQSFQDSLKKFFCNTKLLFQDKMFLIAASVLGLTNNIIDVEILHLSQLVRKITHYSTDYGLSSSVLSGLVIVVTSLSGIFAVFVSAKVLQLYKRYSIQTIFGTSLSLCSAIGILLFYHYNVLSGLFLGNFIFSCAKRFCVVPVMEAVTRHTYPMNEAFVSSWSTGIGSLILVVFSEIARLISDCTTPGSALIVMCVALFVSFILSLFFKPNNLRLETEIEKRSEGASCGSSEHTPLVSEREN